MKFLIIAQDVEQGGSANILLDNVDFLRNKGIEVELLISHKGRFSEFCEKNGIKYYIDGHVPYYIGGGSTPIRKFIKRILYPALLFRYVIKRELAVKKDASMIDFESIDAIYTNYNGDDIGAILSQKFQKRHIWHIREFGELDFECISLRRNYIEFMNKSNSTFIAISNAIREWWISKGINGDSMVRIYDSVNSKGMGEHLRENDGANKLRCVLVGAIHPNKGQEQLIDAISLIKCANDKISVDFYGTGAMDYICHLKKKIKALKLTPIFRFNGYVPRVKELIKNYDVGFVCSKSEGFGLVTVEYMLSGLTIIGANSGATREIITNYETGMTYDYGDIESLADTIKIVINDEALRSRLGRVARKTAIKRSEDSRNEFYSFLAEMVH